jgi:membrane protein DedA with SNARE-associated domain
MKQDEKKCCDQHPTVKVGKTAPESSIELPEVVLVTLAIIGSTLGAIGGTIISKFYLDSFSPTACGMFGCMLGCAIMYTVGYYCWMLFRSAKTTELKLGAFGSVEKCMEEEVHASGHYS